MTSPERAARIMNGIGRAILCLSTVALLGAWIATPTTVPVLGLGPEHLFADATVLALLGIVFLFDALLHRQRV